ncbi:MAG: HisA/HisF-related TIM barrel protein [Gemmatimonadota bacterium]
MRKGVAPVEVIAVLDVRGGEAVHARRGERQLYRPVSSVLTPGADPVALARAFVDRLGLWGCYLADLGAIGGALPDLGLIRRLAAALPGTSPGTSGGAVRPSCGGGLWVDAGVRDGEGARRLLEAGATRAVVGLETLPGRDALFSIASAAPPDRLAFSLDLRAGHPVATAPAFQAASPAAVMAAVAEAGYGAVILLDLARVGTATGPPFALIDELRGGFPDVLLLVGGGVRHADDLRRLADAGCAGALVATALHDGTISRADVEAVAG